MASKGWPPCWGWEGRSLGGGDGGHGPLFNRLQKAEFIRHKGEALSHLPQNHEALGTSA